jgi:tellurite resistance protein
MIKEFVNLTDREVELMLKAPVLVCILIAGADGTIDRKEIKEAIAQTQKKNKATLAEYLHEVSQDFEDKLKILIQSYPRESTQRNRVIMEEISQLNGLWKKFDRRYSAQVYQMLRELAAKVASSSGGIWGVNTIGDEEAKYLKLSTLSDPAQLS